ncbi:hypothetical protein FGB62_25g63 [Gracilaria domingensis]|nr:hypothetical protein FGB62_25g63 [Gracilaria domingensis]
MANPYVVQDYPQPGDPYPAQTQPPEQQAPPVYQSQQQAQQPAYQAQQHAYQPPQSEAPDVAHAAPDPGDARPAPAAHHSPYAEPYPEQQQPGYAPAPYPPYPGAAPPPAPYVPQYPGPPPMPYAPPPLMYGPPPVAPMYAPVSYMARPMMQLSHLADLPVHEIVPPSELALVLPAQEQTIEDPDLVYLLEKAHKYSGLDGVQKSRHKYAKYTFLAGFVLAKRGLPPQSVPDDPDDVYVKLLNLYVSNPTRMGPDPEALLIRTLAKSRNVAPAEMEVGNPSLGAGPGARAGQGDPDLGIEHTRTLVPNKHTALLHALLFTTHQSLALLLVLLGATRMVCAA